MRVIVNGYLGALGRTICRLASDGWSADGNKTGHSTVIAAGVDIAAGDVPDSTGVQAVFRDIESCSIPADVIIECSTAAAAKRVTDYAVKARLPLVICTTGFSEPDEEAIKKASELIPIFKSANMSVGVSLVRELLKKAAAMARGYGFDIEIIEKHHNAKLDAPSGTALMLADAIRDGSDEGYEYIYDRTQERRPRGRNEIGIHSVRGGTITGEHSVILAGRGESIELTHSAFSRDIFAEGALRAAAFISGKSVTGEVSGCLRIREPGLYDMNDLMGNTP